MDRRRRPRGVPAELGARLAPAVVLVAALVVQSTAVPSLLPRAVTVHLGLLVVGLLGLAGGPAPGLGYGLLAGYLEMSLLGATPGAFLVSRGLLGAAAGVSGRYLARDHWLSPVLISLAGALLAEAVYALMAPGAPLGAWALTVATEAACNAALAPLIHPLARRAVEVARPL